MDNLSARTFDFMLEQIAYDCLRSNSACILSRQPEIIRRKLTHFYLLGLANRFEIEEVMTETSERGSYVPLMLRCVSGDVSADTLVERIFSSCVEYFHTTIDALLEEKYIQLLSEESDNPSHLVCNDECYSNETSGLQV